MTYAQQLLAQLKIAPDDVSRLEQGKAVSFDVTEKGDKELAVGLAMYFPSTPDRISTLIKFGRLESIDADISAYGYLPEDAGVADFNQLEFGTMQEEEADSFLQAKPGDRFNLSSDEYRSLSSIESSGIAVRETAARQYRAFLLRRLQAYKRDGLKGVAPYDRDGNQSDTASALREFAISNHVLAQYFPDLYRLWLNYPADLPTDTEEKYLWFNLTIEDRPTPVLAHRIIRTNPESAVILARQFYVGHSYDASELTIGCFAYREGAIVFYARRMSTARVAGIGSGLRHSIGRARMRSEMLKRMQRLKQDALS
ncbi:hypothetical protein [Methylomonas sp. MgM2]